jgi:hypothetical protein
LSLLPQARVLFESPTAFAMKGLSMFAMAGLASSELYCPTQNDFQIDGKNAHWNGEGGWTVTGGAGIHGKQTFNLLGGYIEFEMDTSNAHTGVNNNLYLVSPDPSYFKPTNDCDIQGVNKPSCMEMDIVENNGNCLAQATWHTWPNHKGDCDRGGCWGQKYRSGVSQIRAEFSQDGWMTVSVDGQKIDVSNPVPSESAHKYVHDTMASVGAQIQSSQWVGWVPSGNCQGGGGLDSSTYSIKNIKVSGSVVQGSAPPTCSSPAPGPSPTPPSPPAPSPSQCPGNQGQCGCDWAKGGAGCGADDGTECFCRCCCDFISSHACKWHSHTNATVVV